MDLKKDEKGITLIALAVTLCVMLIIAGISISSASGKNGIMDRTYDIKDELEDKEEKDAIRIAIQETMIANNNGKLEKISFEKKLKQHLDIINFEYDENTKKYKFVSFKSGIEYEVNEKGEIL